ncbi:MAG: alpha/beta hydrolase [Lachnospiraceae bacterium]|jgi:hypothetical protein|nr:alpha/beta hydrolase [Lachnospiraceae bacterium]
MNMTFDDSRYQVIDLMQESRRCVYRAFEHIPYVEAPEDAAQQRLSIFVPEEYYQGKSIGGYSLATAPILLQNSVGGYMPGPEERPGRDFFMQETNTAFYALLHGYVVVSPGVRGRGMKNAAGQNIGVAPAAILDLKAAVRYLKSNKGKVPGDTDRIISNGTSAGGALSSLLGATGNHPDYLPALRRMGAAEADDSIFAASCYCPITNLDHADMAYEWEFAGLDDYHRMQMDPPAPGEDRPRMTPVDAEMSEEQKELSGELKKLFPAYLNSLGLRDEKGLPMRLDADGKGTFREHTATLIMASAQKELDRLASGKPGERTAAGKYEGVRHSARNTAPSPAECPALTVSNGRVTGIDFDAFVRFRTRMKETPAFDSMSLHTAENELFGSADIRFRHFTDFSMGHDKTGAGAADAAQVRLMNPMNYIGDPDAVKAAHFRIRHGAVDRDTSLAVSEMLALSLTGAGFDCDIAHPWGIPHAGDYDLDEMFAWIDRICASSQN